MLYEPHVILLYNQLRQHRAESEATTFLMSALSAALSLLPKEEAEILLNNFDKYVLECINGN